MWISTTVAPKALASRSATGKVASARCEPSRGTRIRANTLPSFHDSGWHRRPGPPMPTAEGRSAATGQAAPERDVHQQDVERQDDRGTQGREDRRQSAIDQRAHEVTAAG